MKVSKLIAIGAVVVVAAVAVWQTGQTTPTGKPGSTPTISENPATRTTAKSWGPFERPTFRHFYVKGAAANTSIYVSGIVINSDQILEVWGADTTKSTVYTNFTDSTYIQDSDTIRCGTSTAGYLLLGFWYDKP